MAGEGGRGVRTTVSSVVDIICPGLVRFCHEEVNNGYFANRSA